MGHKVNPVGLRLGINRTWDSRWYADGRDYARMLHEDLAIRRHVMQKFARNGVSKVVVERQASRVHVFIHAARPGVVIGKNGVEIAQLKEDIKKIVKATADNAVSVNAVELRKPETDAYLIAENVAQQLERRVSFRRAMKRAVQAAMRLGAQGIRINVGGRLGGAEIARTEWYREGRVPLHTLRADIDFGRVTAHTAYGSLGIKTWVFKGEVLGSGAETASGGKQN